MFFPDSSPEAFNGAWEKPNPADSDPAGGRMDFSRQGNRTTLQWGNNLQRDRCVVNEIAKDSKRTHPLIAGRQDKRNNILVSVIEESSSGASILHNDRVFKKIRTTENHNSDIVLTVDRQAKIS